ncbi:signal transduction histidine kinase [Parabacteroides sp. PFB2-10]|nr:signal transduction histidine kinase [Parabacteroides sp. PFB2-10]
MSIKTNILYWCLLLLFPGHLYCSSLKTDDIIHELETLSPHERLSYLAEITQGDKIEKEVIVLYKTEAEKQANKDHFENALYREAYYYYPDSLDGIVAVLGELEPLLLESKNIRRYFQVEMWHLRILTRTGKNQQMLSLVQQLKKRSEELHYPEANEMIDQEIAYFYLANNMLREAEEQYMDVLQRFENRSVPISLQLPVYINLFSCVENKERQLELIHQAERIVEQLKQEGVKYLENENPLYQYDMSLEWNYAECLLADNKEDEALIHIKNYERVLYEQEMDSHLPNLYQLYVTYYVGKKDNEHTLYYLEKIEEYCREKKIIFNLYSYLKTKADLLVEMGQLREALHVKDEMIQLNDTLNKTSYHESLAAMRTRHEVEQLELENQQMEMEARQNKLQTTFLLCGCMLLILLVLALTYMVWVINKNKKILTEAKEKAEEADKMKSAFLANMNHEIRTPLNAIVGFSQVLIDEEDHSNRAEFAHIIEQNNELLQRLIGDVLDLSKIESNSMSLINSKQDIARIMHEIYNTFLLRMPPGVELILDETFPLTFLTDRNRLVQVITNLLTNAIKHTPEGHIRLGYRQEGNRVVFYVEDTGDGIPKEQQKPLRTTEEREKGCRIGSCHLLWIGHPNGRRYMGRIRRGKRLCILRFYPDKSLRSCI